MPPACPDCGSSRIEPRARTGDWRCKECSEVFDQPGDVNDTRDPQTGLAAMLWQMDPDDLVADGGGTLVCDDCLHQVSKVDHPDGEYHCPECNAILPEDNVAIDYGDGRLEHLTSGGESDGRGPS